MEKITSKRIYLYYFIFLILVVVHLWMVNCYAINMPYLDDYTFLIDILHLKAVPFTCSEFIKTIFTPTGPHLEHLILFGRLAAILDFFIEGEVNFRTLFFIGNVTLILTVWLLFYISHKSGLSVFHILPIAFLFFQPQYYENTTTWTICALQHVPALFFAFLTFYLLSHRSTILFLLSFPSAILGIFSNGNGVAVLVVGFILLILVGDYTRLIVWFLFSILSFYFYYRFTHAYPSSDNITNITHPLRVLGGFFLMNGSMGLLFTRSLIGLSLLGILVTSILVIVVGNVLIHMPKMSHWSRYLPRGLRAILSKWSVDEVKPASITLIASCFYLIFTIAGISFARSLGWHYSLLLPRTIWFTTVLVVVGYLLVMLSIRPVYYRRVSTITLFLSILFNLFSYWFTLDEVINVNKSLSSDLHNWRENKLLITMPPDHRSYDKVYSLLLEKAIEQNIYTLPRSDFESTVTDSVWHIDNNLKLIEKDSTFRFSERQHEQLTLLNDIYSSSSIEPIIDIAYLLLRSDKNVFVWPIDQSIKKTASFLINGQPSIHADVATIFLDMLPETSYRVGILYKVNTKWQAKYSSKFIYVKHAHDVVLADSTTYSINNIEEYYRAR